MAQGRRSNWWIGAVLVTIGLCLVAAWQSEEQPFHSRRLLLQLLDTKRITISNERLPVMDKYCPATNFQPIDQQESVKAVHRYEQLGRFFQFDSKLLRAVVRKDVERPALSQYVTQRSVLFLLPICLGLIVCAMLFCCLAVCVCKPQYRPAMCDGLRGDPGSTNCCAILSILLLFVVLLLGLVAAYYSLQLYRNIKESQCQASQLLNTVTYGGVTRDHANYFVGIRTAKELIATTTSHVQNMVTNMSKDIEASRQKIDILTSRVRSGMEQVADKTNPNNTFALTYYLPIPSVHQIQSRFGETLGAPSHPFSMLGGMYLLMRTADLGTIVMGKIEHLIESYRPKLQSKLSAVDGLLVKESTVLNHVLDRYDKVMFLTDILGRGASGAAIALFIGVATVSLACIVAAIGYFLVNNHSWRCCMTTCFVFAGVLCMLSFVISVAATFALPAMYAGCKPLHTALSNPTNFRNLAMQVGLDKHKATVVSKCFSDGNAEFLKPGQRNKIIRQLGMGSQLLKVSDLITNANMGFLSAAARKIHDYINDYYTAAKLDIAYDGQVMGWFERLADHSELISVCSNNNKYQQDRLLPSISPKGINCPSELIVDCRNFGGCKSGCIDLTATMMHYNTSKEWVADVKKRYGRDDCGHVLAAVLGALYNNWHRPRIDPDIGIGGVKKRFEAGPLANIALIDKTIADFKLKVHQDVAKLKELSERTIDGQYGVLTVGTNCRVIGEKAIAAKNTVCYRTFNSVYQFAVAASILSFTLMLAMVLLACSLIRHDLSENLGSKLDGDSPCCCCPAGEDARYSHRSSFPVADEVAPPAPFEIQRIQSGRLRYSSPSTAMNSRLYPIADRESVPPVEPVRLTNISWLNPPNRNNRNRYDSMPRINQ